MADVLAPFRMLLKLNSVEIDNNVFRLHYRLTVTILVVFALIIGSRKYFGDPIDCTFRTKAVEKIVDNFCWFNSYIIVAKDPNDPYQDSREGFRRFKTVIVDGVQRFEDLGRPGSKHPNLKPYFVHAYQWMEFILFFQAMLFFIPRYLWRYCWEQGKIKALTMGFHVVSTKCETNIQKLSEIVHFIKRSKMDNLEYAGKFLICEVLNISNVLVQFLIVKSTFGLEPHILWEDFLSSDSNAYPENPLNLAFPNLARCEVPSPTGGGRVLDLELCVLPLNVFVKKVYIFLWFYFLGLTVVSGLSLAYRLVIIVLPPLRGFLIRRAGIAGKKGSSGVGKNLGYGEWFLLSLVCKNMDPCTFKILIDVYNGNDIITYRPSASSVTTEEIQNTDFDFDVQTKRNGKLNG